MSTRTGTLDVVIEALTSSGNWRYVPAVGGGPLNWADLREAERTGMPPICHSLEVALDRQAHYEQQENDQ